MSRLKPKERRKQILDTALQLAKEKGFESLTRAAIAKKAQITPALITTHYYSTMPQLRRAVMRAAVKQEILEIIAYVLATSNPHALKASSELKERAIKQMGDDDV